MTPAPWNKLVVGDEALFATEGGKYVAILTTRLGPDGQLWIMDPEDLQVMLTSTKLLEAMKDSTGLLVRLGTRYPQEPGLTAAIQKNRRLISESQDVNNG